MDSGADSNGGVDVGDMWINSGSPVVITATANNGHHFDGWNGDVPPEQAYDNPLTLTMDRAYAPVASFAPESVSAHYVSPAGGHQWPYTNWADAATNIQSAVNAANDDGDTVIVTNAKYRLSSQISVVNGITVRSVNGPRDTVVEADGTSRCFYLAHTNAVIDGFAITGGKDDYGGGVYASGASVVRDCIIEGNSSENDGGGVYMGLVSNCLVYGNSASGYGGGLYQCDQVTSSTIVSNAAGSGGGGTYGSSNLNCIVYDNTGGNYSGGAFSYSCTTPLASGEGNITNDPQFVSATAGDYHKQLGSPCINTGTNMGWMAGAVDLDGNDRLIDGVVDMGCYEFGPLHCSFDSDTYIEVNQAVVFSAYVSGTNTSGLSYSWDFDGDGTPDLEGVGLAVVTNTFSACDIYSVSLTVSNAIGEVTTHVKEYFITVHSSVLHVSPDGSHIWPYVNWRTAATNIQAAIDAASAGDSVLVSNGTYVISSSIVISNAITVRSINGPDSTIIDGNDSVRCVSITGASHGIVHGFTLTRGYGNGGGAYVGYYGLLENCKITGNHAPSVGGGVYLGSGSRVGATLRNCLVVSNRVWSRSENAQGGGVAMTGWCVVDSCTIMNNSAIATGYRSLNGGGGLYSYNSSSVKNSIIQSNTVVNGSGPNLLDIPYPCVYLNNCISPAPAGVGMIANAPQILDAASSDYRLSHSSACVDAGANLAWMDGATDLNGNPRILNGTVDIGAYELAFRADLRVHLEGAYDTNANTMTTSLRSTNAIPLTSPYAVDRRTVLAIPTNITDWVLVELRDDTNTTAVFSKSAFLRADGYIVSDDGTAGIMVDVSPGDTNYVVVKHRNHMAVMSAIPVLFTNLVVAFDFATHSSQFYGGSNGAVELEPGVWGMVAGDADGDGEILAVDQLIHETQSGLAGYHRSDFNLDGSVSSEDTNNLWVVNQRRQTVVPNGGVVLSPSLSVLPSRKTLLSGEQYTFSAEGSTGEVTWAFVKDPSGGTFNSETLVYQAGVTPDCVDIIEAWDAENLLGRAYMNVISSNDVALAGKAIVIAGRRSTDDPVWPITDYMANYGFNSLLYRGFSKANIHYLSPEPEQDVDGNGLTDDIDLETTFSNVATTMTNWAANPGKLFIYLVDHGGDSSGNGYFRLNASETLTAAQLDIWLDNLQDTYNNEVTVVIDCCHSGSFLDELSYGGPAKRIVITSCSAGEATYFVAGGLVSFSDAFFTGMLLGLDVESSFLQARDAMSTYQTSLLDDTGDGLYLGGDGAYAATVTIGSTLVAGKDVPQIGLVRGNQILAGDTVATLWADSIVSVYPVERVWGMIVPPGHDPDPDDPVADVVELDLVYDDSLGRYHASYDGFTEDGSYKVIYYAKDIWGSVSLPEQSYVTQAGFDERVILVAGGSTNDANWTAINSIANLAYHTFRQRWFDNDSIYYMSADTSQDIDGDGTNDVDSLASWGSLSNSVADWAGTTNWGGPADKLTIYIIGANTNSDFRINESESLSATELDQWLDAYQTSIHVATPPSVNVVLEFPGSGGFLPGLTSPEDCERVVVASTRAGGTSIKASGGLVSFSSCFLGGIFRGQTIGSAFFTAARYARLISGFRQIAQIDDNGDGVFSSSSDGDLAGETHIGTAFMTGADVPSIGAATPDTYGVPGTNLVLWASGVTDVDGISNVWCVMTPPDYDGEGDLLETNLTWNAGNSRYETLYTNFTQAGTYVCTFYAIDNVGEISIPVQSVISTGDDYEIDDTALQASSIIMAVKQEHNFHSSNDVDWVKFYALTNYVYEIKIDQIGTNVNTSFNVYRELLDGSLTNMGDMATDLEGKGTNAVEIALMVYPEAGIYYVAVEAFGDDEYGPGTEYDLTVWVPAALDGVLVVAAIDKLGHNAPPPGSVAIVEGVATQAFNGNVTVEFAGLTPGTYTVRVPDVAGYRPEDDPATPNAATDVNSYLYGNPRVVDISADSWQVSMFQFVPYAQVDALLRDDLTGARMDGAKIEFVALSGNIAGLTYDGYPNNAAYKSDWFSLVDGKFPTNVLLPVVDWDVRITKPTYSDCVLAGGLTNINAGQFIDLGTLRMQPSDTNVNSIGDAWEDAYFPGQAADKTADEDRDGLNNLQEYLSGTDPTNSSSVFECESLEAGNSMTLTWSVAPGRAYQVLCSQEVTSNSWPVVAGPWEATNGQTQMQWIDTNYVGMVKRFYRVELVIQ